MSRRLNDRPTTRIVDGVEYTPAEAQRAEQRALARRTSRSSTSGQRGIFSSLARQVSRRFSSPSHSALVEILDPEQALEEFRREGLVALQPRELYNSQYQVRGRTLFLQRHSFQRASVLEGNTLSLPVYGPEVANVGIPNVQPESLYVHPGVFVMGIKHLGRKQAGGKVLLVLRDTRRTDENKSVLGCMELDMSQNAVLAFCNLDFVLSWSDAKKYIKIFVQTKGFEDMIAGENLEIMIAYCGRLGTTSSMQYQIQSDELVEMLASKGIKCIPPMAIKPIEGAEWNLRDMFQETEAKISIPTASVLYKNSEGNISLRFGGYRGVTTEGEPSEPQIESTNNTIGRPPNPNGRRSFENSSTS